MLSHYARKLFALLLIVAAATSIFEWGRYYRWADVFTTLQALAYALFLMSEASEKKNESKSTHIFDSLGFLVCLTFSIVIVLWKHLSSGLWLDELSQFFFVDLAAKQLPFSVSAATQQQPTLDMYFQLLSQKIFRSGEIVIRFFPGLFFLLSSTQVWDLVKRRTSSSALSLLAVTVFISHPFIQYFSLEGRPYILGVFVLTLFLRHFYQVILEDEKRTKNIVGFALSGGVLLSAIGFQPPLIVFAAILSLFISNQSIRKLKAYYGSIIFLGLSLSSIYYPIIKDSLQIEKVGVNGLSQGKSFFRILEDVIVGFSGGSYSESYHYLMIGLFVSFIFVVTWNLIRSRGRDLSGVHESFVILMVATLTTIAFTYFINWPYFEKFSILGSILLIIVSVTMLARLLRALCIEIDNQLVKSLVLVSSLYIFTSIFLVRTDSSSFDKENWRAFKKSIDNLKPVGIAPLSLLDNIMPPIFSVYGHKIYFSEDHRVRAFELRPSNTRGRNVLRLRPEMFELPLVLAMPRIWSQDDLDPLLVESLAIGSFRDRDGFRFWYGNEGEEQALRFIKSLAWFYAGQPWTFSLLETMLVYYSSNNNQQITREVEERLWDLLESRQKNKKLGVLKLGEDEREDYLLYFSELKKNVH